MEVMHFRELVQSSPPSFAICSSAPQALLIAGPFDRSRLTQMLKLR